MMERNIWCLGRISDYREGGLIMHPLGVFTPILLIVSFALLIWAAWEIFTSKNDVAWKALWILEMIVCFYILPFGALIGVAIYFYVGRKGVKQQQSRTYEKEDLQ